MFSQTAEHALRALLYLAGRPDEGAVSAEEIAASIGAPRNYLGKTLNTLTRLGVLSAVRGRGGGFLLTADPEEIRIADVMQMFEPPAERPMCLLGRQPCNARRPCAAHERWTAMWQESREPLQRTTLAELLGSPGPAPEPVMEGSLLVHAIR